jgi:hypothetical protein
MVDLILDENLILPNLNNYVPSNSIFLEESMFSQFFDIMINLLRENKKNDICMFSSLYTTDYFIKIDYDNYNYQIPDYLNNYLIGCRLQNIRYYILPLKIIYNKSEAHSNVIIVDTFNKTVEFFEPHGEKYANNNVYDTPKHVMKILDFLFSDISHSLKIINTQENCPIGLQARQNLSNPSAGHCLAWSLLYISIRLLNLTQPIESVINYFAKFSNSFLDIYIRKFITFLEIETILENEKMHQVKSYNLKPFDQEKIKIEFIIKKLLKQYLDLNITDEQRHRIFDKLISYRNYINFNVLLFQAFYSHQKELYKYYNKQEQQLYNKLFDEFIQIDTPQQQNT